MPPFLFFLFVSYYVHCSSGKATKNNHRSNACLCPLSHFPWLLSLSLSLSLTVLTPRYLSISYSQPCFFSLLFCPFFELVILCHISAIAPPSLPSSFPRPRSIPQSSHSTLFFLPYIYNCSSLPPSLPPSSPFLPSFFCSHRLEANQRYSLLHHISHHPCHTLNRRIPWRCNHMLHLHCLQYN